MSTKSKPKKLTEKQKVQEKLFNDILNDIAEQGYSWRKALTGRMSSRTFNNILSNNEDKVKQYARAIEQRADLLADEMFDISDGTESDDNIKVQRDRLKIDTRKWGLSKMHPKKYGDKIDVGVTGNVILHFDKDDEKA